ncbi:N-alpha-acetyltransferase 40 [Leucoagaricus sp. SymC.cos]|nr:N-alpha-acetyltransferase 40 [Leucoagaricus sp. SymC.cos]
MGRTPACVRQAINASSNELLACLGKDNVPVLIAGTGTQRAVDAETEHSGFSILHSLELGDEEKTAIWGLFEGNMRDLYSGSSFGWNPADKKKEIFHMLSRFLLVYDPDKKANLIAFCMFRFENEEGEDVVYCYDIQISSQYHRIGVGRRLIHVLCVIGKVFGMEKVLLTVLKGIHALPYVTVYLCEPPANAKAMVFYRACGFQVDPNSPSKFLTEDSPERDKFDYEIMSRELRT